MWSHVLPRARAGWTRQSRLFGAPGTAAGRDGASRGSDTTFCFPSLCAKSRRARRCEIAPVAERDLREVIASADTTLPKQRVRFATRDSALREDAWSAFAKRRSALQREHPRLVRAGQWIAHHCRAARVANSLLPASVAQASLRSGSGYVCGACRFTWCCAHGRAERLRLAGASPASTTRWRMLPCAADDAS